MLPPAELQKNLVLVMSQSSKPHFCKKRLRWHVFCEDRCKS